MPTEEQTMNTTPPRRGRPPKTQIDPFSEDDLVATPQEIDEALSAIEALDSAPPITPRPSMRGDMRSESPRERAARRAAEIKGHVGTLEENTDEFYIPAELVPEGWTYEWKRKTVLGMEDPAHSVQLALQGWENVPADRHPAMMPTGIHQNIERKGMVLMERPKVITDEVREIEYRKARQQVRHKEQQLTQAPEGQFERNHPQAQPKIKHGYEPMPVPKD